MDIDIKIPVMVTGKHKRGRSLSGKTRGKVILFRLDKSDVLYRCCEHAMRVPAAAVWK